MIEGGHPFEQLPEELRALAERALSNARRELEAKGALCPVVLFRFPDGTIENAVITNRMLELYGDDARGRSLFFEAIRMTVRRFGITAVVLANDMWTGKATERFNALSPARKKQLLNGATVTELAQRGWMTRHEAVMVSVQTPEQVAMVEQIYERDNAQRRITWGERCAHCFPQETFSGRMKLYGRESVTKTAGGTQ